MKATKTELIRLARLAQKDVASGRVSKNAQQAVEALSDYQNSAIELLDLTLEEATQEQSNKSLVDSFGFLFGQSLEALRLELRPSPGGSAFATVGVATPARYELQSRTQSLYSCLTERRVVPPLRRRWA